MNFIDKEKKVAKTHTISKQQLNYQDPNYQRFIFHSNVYIQSIIMIKTNTAFTFSESVYFCFFIVLS